MVLIGVSPVSEANLFPPIRVDGGWSLASSAGEVRLSVLGGGVYSRRHQRATSKNRQPLELAMHTNQATLERPCWRKLTSQIAKLGLRASGAVHGSPRPHSAASPKTDRVRSPVCVRSPGSLQTWEALQHGVELVASQVALAM